MTDQQERLHAHVVGVAGVGMSAVAELLLAQGYRVSGSDRFLDKGENLDVLDRLSAAGVQLVSQDGSAVTSHTNLVAVSTAIEADNPDLLAARRLGARVLHRAAVLAEAARGKTCIAVTGTSGKTTVTGMIGWILEQLGLDPTVVNGGVVLDWQAANRVGNVRWGRGDWWVVEADESDKSLLQFAPEWAVITNVSKDHFELDEVVALFCQFAAKIGKGIVGGPGVRRMLGLAAETEDGFSPVMAEGRWGFQVSGFRFQAPVAGRHNAENAFVAVRLCRRLGLPLDRVSEALSRFRGISRRLERVGEARGVVVVDDYAHNPAKIRASWSAVAETAPRILGLWRPHGFGPLALMRDDLVSAFAGVCRAEDRLWMLPVFYAGGTADQRITSEDLVRLLVERGVRAEYAGDYDNLERRLLETCRAGDTMLLMGARDPELPRCARRLVQRLAGLC
jgi:UDP-N-acetylmuramate--alanine ligase